MKFIKVATIIVFCFVLGVAVWNKIQVHRCAEIIEKQHNEKSELIVGIKEVEEALVKAQSYSMTHLDQQLLFLGLEGIHPKTDVDIQKVDGPCLILVFSELGCNVCADKETDFAKGIYKKYGSGSVLAIVHAKDRRYVKGYIRLNQVPFPVFYCLDDTFLKENNIMNTPIIFVMNEERKIIAAHFPLPGQAVYSKPFHNFCNFYFERSLR